MENRWHDGTVVQDVSGHTRGRPARGSGGRQQRERVALGVGQVDPAGGPADGADPARPEADEPLGLGLQVGRDEVEVQGVADDAAGREKVKEDTAGDGVLATVAKLRGWAST